MLTVGGKAKILRNPVKEQTIAEVKPTLIGAAAGIMLIVHMQNVGRRTLHAIPCVPTASERDWTAFLPQPHKRECCLSRRSLQQSRFPAYTQRNYSLEYFKAPILRPNCLTIVFETVIRIPRLSVNSAEMRQVHP